MTDGQDFFSIFPTRALSRRGPSFRSFARSRGSASAAPRRRRRTLAGRSLPSLRGLGGSLRVVLQEVRREELHRVVRSLLHQRLHPLQEDGHHRGLEVLADGEGLHVDLVLRLERRLLRRGRRLGVVVPGVLVRGLGFGRGRLGRNLVCSNGREGWRRCQERGEAGAEEGPPRVAGANRGGERAPSAGASSAIVTRACGRWRRDASVSGRSDPGARPDVDSDITGSGARANRSLFRARAPLRTRVRLVQAARPSRSSLAGAVGTGLGAPSGRGHARGRRSDDRVAAPRVARRRRASPLGRRTPVGRRGAARGCRRPPRPRPVPPAQAVVRLHRVRPRGHRGVVRPRPRRGRRRRRAVARGRPPRRERDERRGGLPPRARRWIR